MEKEISTKSRIILTILFGLTGILLFVYILVMSESRLARKNLEEEMKDNSSYILEAYGSYEGRGSVLKTWSDDIHESYLLTIMRLFEENPELLQSPDTLSDLGSIMSVQDILLIDKEGNVITSDIGFFKDLKNPIYAPLLESFDTWTMKKLMIYPFSEKMLEERKNALEAYQKNEQNGVTGETNSEETDDYSDWEKTYYGLSNSFPVLYALPIGENTAAVIIDYGETQLSYENQTDAWNYTLKNEVIGSGGFAFVWSRDTGEILYYPDPTFRNQNISVLGIDVNKIHDKEFVTQEVGGTSMYLYPVYFSDHNAWVVCGVPSEELSAVRKPVMYLMWLIFGMLAADLVYYAVLLLKQKKAVREENFHPLLRLENESGRKKKLLTFTVFCTVAVFLSSFYLQTLYLMSEWSKNSTSQISKIETEQKNDELLSDQIRFLYQINSEKLMKLAGWYIEKNPDMVTPESLDILTSILDLDSLWVTDEHGTTIAASSFYQTVSANPSEEKDKASDGEGEENTSDSSESVPKNQSIRIPLRADGTNITGYANGTYVYSDLEEMLTERNLGGTLRVVQPGEGAFVFAVNQESQKFTWYPDSSLIGKKALDYGLRESDLQDNLCQYIQVNRNTYYAVTGKYEGNLIFMAILKDKLLSQRLPITITASVTALIILLVIGIWVYTCPETEYATEAEPPEGKRTDETTAEFKVFRALAFGMAAMAAVLLLMRYLRPETSSDSMLEYVQSGNWEHGLNVFALTASLIIVLEGGLGLFLLNRLTEFMTSMLSLRARTVIRMIASLVSYTGGFIILYQCLVYLGMDPTALMASAGIVSVVIGIGANSLVGDILAGIFLLIEGNIQVGDMISVGGFRGIVEDLGIRMTKIYDVDSEDIKIIPNKEVQNVVHMSAHPANLFLEYQICYEEDIERVEKLLVEELKKPDGRIPEIIGDLVYLGVRRLDESGVVLLVRARCHEAYRPRVTRAVNRKIYMMFRRNGIEVPFPQLTIHTENE